MIRLTLLLSLLALPAWAGDLPDPSLTPGAVNPDVTAANIHQTICVSGWTKTIRPPASYTNKLKLDQMRVRGIAGKPSDFEEDHLISIELAGHPTDPKNLWPQHWAEPWGARDKDATETALKRLVCAGKVSLADAQRAIATDWISAYKKYVGPGPHRINGPIFGPFPKSGVYPAP